MIKKEYSAPRQSLYNISAIQVVYYWDDLQFPLEIS